MNTTDDAGNRVILHDVFDHFNENHSSPLFGRMSPDGSKKVGRITRVTFNAAAAPALTVFGDKDPEYVYSVLSSYVRAWMTALRAHKADDNIVNPTLFRALLLLFRDVSTRVNDRFHGELTTDHFLEIITPLSEKVRKQAFLAPGRSHRELYGTLSETLRKQVSLGKPK